MSEAVTSSTGRGRNVNPWTCLPIVRTPFKTLERPLGECVRGREEGELDCSKGFGENGWGVWVMEEWVPVCYGKE